MNPDLMYDYAMRLIGVPYRWGGSNALTGFDCSGLVIELLRSQAMIADSGDWNAQSLADMFAKVGTVLDWKTDQMPLGTLAFYGKDRKTLTHIAMVLEDGIVIEAGGGGSATVSLALAQAQNAVVRLRPLLHRRDLVAVIHPLPPLRLAGLPHFSHSSAS